VTDVQQSLWGTATGVPQTMPVRPAARATDPDTSHLAAVTAIHTAAGDRVLALEHLIAAGDNGLTHHCLAHLTGRKQTSIGVRVNELVQQGLVVRRIREDGTPDRRIPLSGSSMACAVWVAVR
jgi:hypothetical protein